MCPDLVLSNPYRLLGVYVNARQADIVKNLNRAKAFLHIDKDVTFPTDSLLDLPVPQRTEASLLQAQSALTLAKDRLQYAFFWLGNETPEEPDGWAHVLNRAVTALVGGDYALASSSYASLLHSEAYRTSFVRAVCDDLFEISEQDLVSLLWSRVLTVVPAQHLLPHLSGSDAACVRGKAVSDDVLAVRTAVSEASSKKDASDPLEILLSGIDLRNRTMDRLLRIRETVGESDPEYRATADYLARQVLHQSVSYVNSCDGSPVDYDSAISLIRYSQDIAYSTMIKERCRINLETLESRKNGSASQPEIDCVMELLRPYTEEGGYTGEISLDAAESLYQSSLPLLSAIQSKDIGGENYKSVSSAVANVCLNIIVDVINRLQDTLSSNKALRLPLALADSLMGKLGAMTLSDETRTRLYNNMETLKSLQSDVAPRNYWVLYLIGSILLILIIAGLYYL